jgi:hypothetical protein
MKTALTQRERQQLIVLAALETRPRVHEDLQECLGASHFVFGTSDVAQLVEQMEKEQLVTSWPVPQPGCADPERPRMMGVQITRLGAEKLHDLQKRARPETLTEVAERFIDQHTAKPAQVQVTACNAPEAPEEEDEATATLCMSEGALNDWWNSLTVDAKAEALSSFYEAGALASESLSLTAAGRAALDSRRMHEVTA